MRKKMTLRTMKRRGRCIQPRTTTQPRKKISTGRLTPVRVSMTRRGLGKCLSSWRSLVEAAIEETFVLAACSAVERRETKIALTPPGRPVRQMGVNVAWESTVGKKTYRQ